MKPLKTRYEPNKNNFSDGVKPFIERKGSVNFVKPWYGFIVGFSWFIQ
jgi:hypothetical protein